MKLIHTLPLIIATACLTFSGCDKKPGTADSGSAPKVVDEKTAIANFKTDVEGVTKWIEEKQKTPPADPAAGMAMASEVIAKFQAIKTDGLPADLKAAWGDMSALMSEMGTIFKSMPTAKPDKPEDAMKAMGEIMPKMMALQAKVEPAAKKLEEVGKKHGLDMSKVAPGK
ncbi:MAG: hypothetical protein ABIP20_11385 [Chthoniobacteraceae bacterium]